MLHTHKKSSGPKRRKYSSNGCNECKRKKLKCDENKPACLRCIKSGKLCSYNQIAKFSEARTIVFRGKSTRLQSPRKTSSIEEHENDPTYPATYVSKSDLRGEKEEKNIDSEFMNGKVVDEIGGNQSITSSINNFEEFDIEEFDQALLKDASLLAHDLNDLMSYDTSGLLNYESPRHETVRVEIQKRMKDDETDENQLEVEELISFFDESGSKNYLRLFYEKYSLWLMPLSNGSKSICNNTLLWHSMRCSFLLDAILSITARYEHFVHNSEDDENSRRYHLSRCLNELCQIFETNESVARFVEPLILTVLVLVADSSSIVNGEWRAHLRGANLIFRKYVTSCKKSSAAIVLSSMWFVSFELLAITSNPLGGIITSAAELEEVMMCVLDTNEVTCAAKYGLVMPDGYNVFLGYTKAGVEMFAEYARISLRIKESKSSATTSDIMKMMHLIHLADQTFFASASGIIEESNPYHPRSLCGYTLPRASHSEVQNKQFCWFDISHKLHVLAVYLKVLYEKQFLNLPRESEAVQNVVKEMLAACHFFEEVDFDRENFSIEEEIIKNNDPLWNDLRLFTVHSTLVICGICAIDKTDKLKIEFYFKRLIRNGAKSLEQSLNFVKNTWSGYSKILDYVAYV